MWIPHGLKWENEKYQQKDVQVWSCLNINRISSSLQVGLLQFSDCWQVLFFSHGRVLCPYQVTKWRYWFREKELRESNTFLIDKTILFIIYLLCRKRSANPQQISAGRNIVGVFLWYSTLKTSDRVFSRDLTPCWYLQIKVRQSWWDPQRILRELNSILMLTFSLVLFEKHALITFYFCWFHFHFLFSKTHAQKVRRKGPTRSSAKRNWK